MKKSAAGPKSSQINAYHSNKIPVGAYQISIKKKKLMI